MKDLTKRSLLVLAIVMVGMFIYMLWMAVTGRRPQPFGVIVVGVAYCGGSAAIATYAALRLDGAARRRAATALAGVLTFLLLMGATLVVALTQPDRVPATRPGVADVVLMSIYFLSILAVWVSVVVEKRISPGDH